MAAAQHPSLVQLQLALATLQDTADRLETAMHNNKLLGKQSSSVLGQLQSSLLQMSKTVAPIHERATQLTWAQQNITSTRAATEELLQCLDTSRRVRCLGNEDCHAWQRPRVQTALASMLDLSAFTGLGRSIVGFAPLKGYVYLGCPRYPADRG